MSESQSDYWSRRATEHAQMAQAASHRRAVAAHNALAHLCRERAESSGSAVDG